MSICTGVPLVSSLFPEKILGSIQNKEESLFPKDSVDKKEQHMLSIAKIIVAIMKKTAQALLCKDLQQFDPTAGDHACQIRIYKVFDLVRSSSLHEEAVQLKKQAEALDQLVKKRSQKGKGGIPTKEFFETNFRSLFVSREMDFLLKSFLLTFPKLSDEKIDPGKLTALSKKLSSKVTKPLIEYVQNVLSQNSLQFFVERLHLSDKTFLQEIFSDEFIFKKDPFTKNFPKKFFSPPFFQLQAVLEFLKEDRATVMIKKIGKGEPIELFYQATGSGFVRIFKEEISKDTPIIVFEAKVRSDFEEEILAEKIEIVGLEKMILLCASLEPPYERETSKLEDLKHLQGQQMIREFRKEAEESGLGKNDSPFFAMQHLSCIMKEKLR